MLRTVARFFSSIRVARKTATRDRAESAAKSSQQEFDAISWCRRI